MPVTFIVHTKHYFDHADLGPDEYAAWDVCRIEGNAQTQFDGHFLRVCVYDMAHNLSFGRGIKWPAPAGYGMLPPLPNLAKDVLPLVPGLLTEMRVAKCKGLSDASDGFTTINRGRSRFAGGPVQAKYMVGAWGAKPKPAPEPEPLLPFVGVS